MGKNVLTLVICGIFTAVLYIVPIVGAMVYGAVIQTLDVVAVAQHWVWLDMYHSWSGFISWLLISLIFFCLYKVITE